MARVFLCNSGAEANECAIKLARKYSFDRYGEGRSTVLTLQILSRPTVTTLAALDKTISIAFFIPSREASGICPQTTWML